MIDISHRMLYNEAKIFQKFHTMMNATVSHELRNPLNSLIGDISNMKGNFINLR